MKKKYGRARQATDDDVEHAHCMLVTQGYKHTLEICRLMTMWSMRIACWLLKICGLIVNNNLNEVIPLRIYIFTLLLPHQGSRQPHHKNVGNTTLQNLRKPQYSVTSIDVDIRACFTLATVDVDIRACFTSATIDVDIRSCFTAATIVVDILQQQIDADIQQLYSSNNNHCHANWN